MIRRTMIIVVILILSGILSIPHIDSVRSESTEFDFVLSVQESGLKDVSDVFLSVDGAKVGLIADQTVYVYDLTTRRFSVHKTFPQYRIYDGCWMLSGILLLVGPTSGETDPIVVLSPDDLSNVSSHSIGESTFTKVFPSPDLSQLALVGKKKLRVVDTDTFETVYSFDHPSQSISTTSWNADGTMVASVGYRIFVHDISSGTNVRIPDSQKNSRGLLWTSDGSTLYNLEYTGTLETYDPVLGELKGTEPVASQFECGAISADDDYILFGEAWNLGMWSVSATEVVASMVNATDEIDMIIWDMDDYRILTIAEDGVFRVYYDRNDPRYNEPPKIVIKYPTDGQTVQDAPVARGTVTDDTAVLAAFYKINDENWATLDEPGSWEISIPTTALVEGENSLFIKASDGDLESTESVTFNYGTSGPTDLPPTIQILSPVNASTVRPIFNVSGTASDDIGVVHVEVSIGDGEWELADGTDDWIFYSLLDGDASGQLAVRARSFDGGQYSAIAIIDVLVNSTSDPANEAPSITLISPEEGESDKWYIDCEGLTEDDGPGATTYLAVDGLDLRPVGHSREWSFYLNISALDTGSHALTFIADDGDRLSAPVTVNITKDPYSPPRVVLTEPEEDSLVFDSITFKGSVEDGYGGFVNIEMRSMDGQWESIDDFRTWSYTYNSSGLPPGDVTFQFRATDIFTWSSVVSIDLIKYERPIINVLSPSENDTVRDDIRLSLEITSGYGDIEFVELRLEDGEWMRFNGSRNFNHTIDVADLPAGGIALDVRASDGIDWSDVTSITLVKRPDEPSTQDTTYWLILVVLVVIFAIAISVMYRRRYASN